MHFIDVLKKALQVLVPVAKLQELDKNNFMLTKPSQPTPEPAEEVSNRYAHLEIQDIDEDTHEKLPNVVTKQSEPKKSLPPTTGKKPKFMLEELEEWSEYLCVLDCFMTDAHNLGDQLKECWEGYVDAKIDLATASVTTNVAIEMIKRAEEDFLKIRRPHGLYDQGDMSIAFAWFAESCVRDGISPRGDVDRKYLEPMEAWDQAQDSYLHLYRFLQVCSHGTTPGLSGPNPIYALTRPAYFGTYNPELEWDNITPERQYEQVAALVNDMLVTVGAFVMLAGSPSDDMLMQGIAELQENQIDPPFWLLFAVQNFVDARFILKTRSERPFEVSRSFETLLFRHDEHSRSTKNFSQSTL